MSRYKNPYNKHTTVMKKMYFYNNIMYNFWQPYNKDALDTMRFG